VSRLRNEGLHAVGGVAGLYLQVKGQSRTWILRATVGSKRRDMGLGAYPTVTLAQARDKAREARRCIDKGADPILERETARAALRAAQAGALTFAEATRRFLEAREAEWRNAKHRQQWANTIETYAAPILGSLNVADIGREHVLQVLEPIWKTKTETATRLRGRIEQILDWAKARGYRGGENPAQWRGHLDKLLPKPRKIAQVEHHKALAIDDVPPFFADLLLREGTAARALSFAILTAARSGEVRGATWAEIDIDRRVWTVPAGRMKAKKEHKVPLSELAVAQLRALPREEGTDLVFASAKGTPLSDMALTAVLRRMNVDAVPHGFRSTFRDWTSERTSFPREVAEMALAHKIENKVEAAYRRGDLLAKRAQLMEAWAKFCQSPVAKAAVIELQAKRA
jgi:integrase